MFLRLFAVIAFVFASAQDTSVSVSVTDTDTDVYVAPSNNCVSFQVSTGTGCQWMCNYCASTLDTTNYYFTDGVCQYEEGGCVGSPQVGVLYTCCAN
jgi:hypothetical protein